MQPNPDGSLTIPRAVNTNALVTTSLVTGSIAGATIAISGDVVVQGGLKVTGLCALQNVTTATLASAGPVAAPSFSSAAGFKTTVSCGKYWHSAYPANTTVQLLEPVINGNGGGAGTTPFVYPCAFAGSVVGLVMNQAGPITGINYLAVYKNGALAYFWTAGAGANNTPFRTTLAKGQVPFTATDTLTVFHSNSAGGNTQISAHLVLEMSA